MKKQKVKNTLSDLGSRVSLFWILLSSNLADIQFWLMIHQYGFSWNTRGITIYSFSDVTTIIHQTKYQLYLFIFAHHFTVLYIFIQNPTQPTHICLYIFPPCFFYWTKHKHPFIQKKTINLPSPPSHLPRCWHGKCRTAGAQDNAQHIQHTQQLAGEPLRAGAGGVGVGRCPRCPKRCGRKNVVENTC